MIRQLNKHQRWLMIVIAVLAIPFVFYFNKTDFSATRSSVAGQLYGRNISEVDFERGVRLFDLARDLGMQTLLQDLAGTAQTERDAQQQFAINRLILLHEADALGIAPSSTEIAAAVENVRAFRGDKGFDLERFNEAVKNYLGPRGFTEAQIEELAADQVRLDHVRQIIGLGVNLPEKERAEIFEKLYSRLEVSVVRLKTTDLEKEVKVSDEDISKYYDSHKEQLRSEEKRRVQFTALELPAEEKKLTGKQRVDALQKLADKANDVHDAAVAKGADFANVVAARKLSVSNTGDFTMSAPDAQFKGHAQLAEAAFQLTTEDPTSDPIQAGDGFYILHLVSTMPALPLTLEQARPKVVEALQVERAREMLSIKTRMIAAALGDGLKKGEPLATAAQNAGVKVEKVPPFALGDDLDNPSPAKASNPVDLPQIKQAVADLKAGEVSNPVPTADGALIAVLEKRDAPDQAKAADERKRLDERVLTNKENIAFLEWLRARRQAAGAS